MPNVPKPVLWWSFQACGGHILSAVSVNKLVWLNGQDVRQHTPFRIRKRNLLTRVPRLGRRLFGSWVGDVPTVYPGDGSMRSLTQWQASHVSLFPSSVDYYFTDDNGGVSGPLAVSNTPTAQWKSVRHGGGGLRPKLEVGLSDNPSAVKSVRAELGHYNNDYEFTFESQVLAPWDPDVEIEVLEPGTSRDLLLETALEVLHRELEDIPSSWGDQYLTAALKYIDSFLGRRYVDFSMNGEARFTATADVPTPFSLTVRRDGPVRLLFAIQIRDRDAGITSISEFMPLIVTQPRRY